MTCQFIENLSLAALVAPVSEGEFRENYWGQKPLIVHRKNPNYYGDLFTLADFDEALAHHSNRVATYNAGGQKQKKHGRYSSTTYETTTVNGLESILASMRAGDTLMLDRLDERNAKLDLLCRMVGPELGTPVHTNLYLTPPDGQGTYPHWDNHDVFILQVVGSKHWKIEKARRCEPDRFEKMEKDDRELKGELYHFTLERGDLVYIPRGYVHAAECGAEPSLHITFAVYPIFFLEEVLSAAIKAASRRDSGLRAGLPPGLMRGGPEPVVRRAMAALREICDETFLRAVVDQYLDELVSRFPLDVSCQVLDFFSPIPLAVEDVVGPRRGTVYRMHAGDNTVRLNVGARSIVFPAFFCEALNFALNTPAYAIREVAGDLQDEERIAFIERLIQEGLVVRKDARK
jgi:ribosomal protein L16 Arg81 hydroxylase